MSTLIKLQAPQPKPSDGKRDALVISTFLNNLNTYFKLARLDEDDDYKTTLAEGYLTGDASYWWSLIPDNQKPTTYEDFEYTHPVRTSVERLALAVVSRES
uniref:Retrotransposon gag domain-containing protein n=1 Tax=Rhodosorus marinus TaxID=101924 RepID=A0A7S2ZX89_9RHOD|mmetsp:Transcript_36356/g.145314  ORF Transcript_36356/g.145314 Transcript_36356/m.145314 type:complete len:101 (+) Transcript_36356:219-521(+)